MAGSLSGLPPDAADTARRSLGATLGVAEKLHLPALADSARVAYTEAMGSALTIGAAVALVAAVIVAIVLPGQVGPSEEQPRVGAFEVETD
jgi:DHA2 family integral membrane protein (MFS transporter)